MNSLAPKQTLHIPTGKPRFIIGSMRDMYQKLFSWYKDRTSIQQKGLLIGGGLIFILLFIGLNFFMFRFGRMISGNQNQLSLVNTKSTSESAPRPLASKGKYKFSVQTGGGESQVITGGILNPVDPILEQRQEFEVTAGEGVTNLSITLKTDTKEQKVPLSQDTNTSNVWRGSWIMGDTYFNTYEIRVEGQINGKNKVLPMIFR